MKAQFKYVHRPANEKWDYLHNLDSQANAKIIMSEKTNIPLHTLLNSLSSKYYKTEVLYPTNTDMVIYQSCPKLTKHFFGLHSKIMIVRAFLFDRQSIKRITDENVSINKMEGILETYFREKMFANYTQLPKVESIMTGLLAIPLSGKQKLLADLAALRNKHIESLKSNSDEGKLHLENFVEKKPLLCEDMPVLNISDSFRVLLRHNIKMNPVTQLLSSDFYDSEFDNFKTKVILYESGVLKLCK